MKKIIEGIKKHKYLAGIILVCLIGIGVTLGILLNKPAVETSKGELPENENADVEAKDNEAVLDEQNLQDLDIDFGDHMASTAQSNGSTNAYTSAVSAIDSKKPKTQKQLDHYDSSTKKKISGNCNISSIITLLNRRLAYDKKSGSYGVANVMSTYGCTNYTQDGTKLYYPNNNCSDGWGSKTYKISGASYTAKRIENKTVKSDIEKYGSFSKDSFYQYVAILLHEHPEGIAARLKYKSKSGGHVIVFTKYALVDNKIQLYVYDPVDNKLHEKLEDSYLYKNCGKADIHKYLDCLCYLKDSEAISFLPDTKLPIFAGQTSTIAPYVGKANATFSSGSTQVCTVDSSGKITAKTTGVADITVKVGKRSEKLRVMVFDQPVIKSLSNGVYRKLTVKWEKNVSYSGYEIQYSTSSSFKDAKTVTVKDTNATSKTIEKLTFNKTYYVRMRSYIEYNGKKYYSNWTKTLSKKIIL